MTITQDSVQIARLEERMKHMEGMMSTMSVQVDSLVRSVDEARGGWRTLMLVGGAAAAIGSAVTWFYDHWTK
jgi:hypothetical protein